MDIPSARGEGVKKLHFAITSMTLGMVQLIRRISGILPGDNFQFHFSFPLGNFLHYCLHILFCFHPEKFWFWACNLINWKSSLWAHKIHWISSLCLGNNLSHRRCQCQELLNLTTTTWNPELPPLSWSSFNLIPFLSPFLSSDMAFPSVVFHQAQDTQRPIIYSMTKETVESSKSFERK